MDLLSSFVPHPLSSFKENHINLLRSSKIRYPDPATVAIMPSPTMDLGEHQTGIATQWVNHEDIPNVWL